MKPKGVKTVDYKQIIESKGIKKSFIADKMGISRQFLYQCFNGKKKLTKKRKDELHRILGL